MNQIHHRTIPFKINYFLILLIFFQKTSPILLSGKKTALESIKKERYSIIKKL